MLTIVEIRWGEQNSIVRSIVSTNIVPFKMLWTSQLYSVLRIPYTHSICIAFFPLVFKDIFSREYYVHCTLPFGQCPMAKLLFTSPSQFNRPREEKNRYSWLLYILIPGNWLPNPTCVCFEVESRWLDWRWPFIRKQ